MTDEPGSPLAGPVARRPGAPTRTPQPRVGRFPLTWRDLATAVGALVVVIAVGAIVGRILVDWAAPNSVTEYDLQLARELVADRTPELDQWARIGSLLSSTVVKIVATLIIAAAMGLVWRRWHEPVLVVGTLLFEAGAFVTITAIVQRQRPPVDQLEGSPIGSSFPSGHVAAATVYAVVLIVVCWHTRSAVARWTAALLVAVVPVLVGAARLYQGMHHLSDVVAGAILGIVSIVICYSILGAPHGAHPVRLRRRSGVADDARGLVPVEVGR